MAKGKPWSANEEAKLRELIEAEKPPKLIAAELGKSLGAIIKKANRLGLEVVRQNRRVKTTTSEIKLPMELPTVEEALKILAGALKAAGQPGLDKVEVQRLQVVATLARTYKDLLSDYIDYRGIETKLMELEVKYAELTRKIKVEGKKAKSHAG